MPSPQSLITRWVVKTLISPILNAKRSVSSQRKMLDRISGIAPLPRGTKGRPLSIKGVPALWIDVNRQNQRVILFLHGGGYNIGSIRSHRELAARLGKAAGANVLLLGYRLAPEHPFPAGLNDAEFAYKWLLIQGYLPENISIAGDSAGGGLALATAMKLRDDKEPLPGCLCLISPWTDLTMSGESVRSNVTKDIMLNPDWMRQMAHNYAGPDGLANPYVSPHYGRYDGLPPMMVHVGADEILLSDSEWLTDRARAAGGDVGLEISKQMWHIWHVHGGYMPEAKIALKKAGAFIKSYTGGDECNGSS